MKNSVISYIYGQFSMSFNESSMSDISTGGYESGTCVAARVGML